MILLISGATATVRRAPANVGVLMVPRSSPRGFGPLVLDLLHTRPWGGDNGAFSGFDAPAFLAMLGRLQGIPGCRFVAAPDVVGNAAATRELFDAWEPRIRAHGLPVALVAQDGLAVDDVPWPRVDALFLGGSTAWKLGAEARALAGAAKARHRWLHMGRVNTRRRFRDAALLRCDSIDGSRFSRWPDTALPLALKWLDRHRQQGELY